MKCYNLGDKTFETYFSYKEKGKNYSSLNSNEHGDVFVDSESDEEVKSESHGNVLQEMNTTEDQPESENLESIPGTLPSSIESAQCIGAADNGSSANTVIKKNLTVKKKLKNSDYFKKAKIICRAGKSTGKYGHCWTIENENEEGFNYIDFDKDVDKWYPCEETEQFSQEVFLNFPVDQIAWNNSELAVFDIFKVELNSETAEAKQSELNVWNQGKAYTSVPDTSQECISGLLGEFT